MAKLTLVRGLPGSGKSTYARTLGGIHIEADMFHVQKDGTYKWAAENAVLAHEWCIVTTNAFLCNGKNVVVSNTFTQLWEIEKYSNLGFECEVFRMVGEYGSNHSVPSEVIEDMRLRFESFPEEKFK